MTFDLDLPWLEIRSRLPLELVRAFNTLHPEHCWLPLQVINDLPYYSPTIPLIFLEDQQYPAHHLTMKLFHGISPAQPNLEIVPCPNHHLCCNPFHLSARLALKRPQAPFGTLHFAYPELPIPNRKRPRGRPPKSRLNYDPFKLPTTSDTTP